MFSQGIESGASNALRSEEDLKSCCLRPYSILEGKMPSKPLICTAVRFPFVSENSIAPNAGQDKAGRSDVPHVAIRGARGENAENADHLSSHTKNWGLRRQNPGASLGTTKLRKPPLRHLLDHVFSGLRWLKVA